MEQDLKWQQLTGWKPDVIFVIIQAGPRQTDDDDDHDNENKQLHKQMVRLLNVCDHFYRLYFNI